MEAFEFQIGEPKVPPTSPVYYYWCKKGAIVWRAALHPGYQKKATRRREDQAMEEVIELCEPAANAGIGKPTYESIINIHV